MELPPAIRKQFIDFGRAGGHARARKLSAPRRRQIARRASIARWTRQRFGAGSFAELGLPGGALIDEGLEAYADETESVEALLVAIARPRLQREGVPVPSVHYDNPELRCYRLLEKTHGELAHARFLALLEQVSSFADACHIARGPHRHRIRQRVREGRHER